LTKDRVDVDKDLGDANGLRELNYRFAKQKKEIELLIYRLTHECQKHHQTLEELQEEKIRLQKQIVSYLKYPNRSF
jgi:hypothetical protein